MSEKLWCVHPASPLLESCELFSASVIKHVVGDFFVRGEAPTLLPFSSRDLFLLPIRNFLTIILGIQTAAWREFRGANYSQLKCLSKHCSGRLVGSAELESNQSTSCHWTWTALQGLSGLSPQWLSCQWSPKGPGLEFWEQDFEKSSDGWSDTHLWNSGFWTSLGRLSLFYLIALECVYWALTHTHKHTHMHVNAYTHMHAHNVLSLKQKKTSEWSFLFAGQDISTSKDLCKRSRKEAGEIIRGSETHNWEEHVWLCGTHERLGTEPEQWPGKALCFWPSHLNMFCVVQEFQREAGSYTRVANSSVPEVGRYLSQCPERTSVGH